MSRAHRLLFFVAAAASVQAETLDRQLSYVGHVVPGRSDDPRAEPQKTFELTYWLASRPVGNNTGDDANARHVGWLVSEQGRGARPWLERAGLLPLATPSAGGTLRPALLFDRGDGTSDIPLRLPLLESPETLAVGQRFERANLQHDVAVLEPLEGRNAWKIELSNNYGAKGLVWRSPDSPLVLAAHERIFMGQGQEYTLVLRLASDTQLPAETAVRLRATLAALTDLQRDLRPADESAAGSDSPRRLEMLAEKLPAIAEQAAGGPLAALLKHAQGELALATQRRDHVAELVEKFEGQPVSPFRTAGLDVPEFSEADLQGRVTVLHFWEYRDSPLEEPYGQVGYLDFLHAQRRGQGVQVVGVAVDRRLDDPEQRSSVVRGVRKLKSFMNLSYPVLLDAGDWLSQLGDPRRSGAMLPLFVVVGPDGRIVHYHVGLYDVARDRGLEALDRQVGAALAAQHRP